MVERTRTLQFGEGLRIPGKTPGKVRSLSCAEPCCDYSLGYALAGPPAATGLAP